MLDKIKKGTGQAGDILGVESQGFVAWEITRCQLREGFDPEAAKTTHIAVIINSHGDLLEAHGGGIRLSNIRHYDKLGWKYHILRHNTANGEDIANMAMRLSHNENFLNKKYDFALIVGLFLISFGMPDSWLEKFNKDSKFICSEFGITIFNKLKIITPKQDKIYWPAEWIVWTREEYFTEIKQLKKIICSTYSTPV